MAMFHATPYVLTIGVCKRKRSKDLFAVNHPDGWAVKKLNALKSSGIFKTQKIGDKWWRFSRCYYYWISGMVDRCSAHSGENKNSSQILN
jgi:hypothetical protein